MDEKLKEIERIMQELKNEYGINTVCLADVPSIISENTRNLSLMVETESTATTVYLLRLAEKFVLENFIGTKEVTDDPETGQFRQ